MALTYYIGPISDTGRPTAVFVIPPTLTDERIAAELDDLLNHFTMLDGDRLEAWSRLHSGYSYTNFISEVRAFRAKYSSVNADASSVDSHPDAGTEHDPSCQSD